MYTIMSRVFNILQENPSATAGGATFAIAFALFAGNAFYAQTGVHPDPIWATRDMTITRSVDPEIRKVSTTLVKPKAIPVPTSSGEKRTLSADPLVRDIQQALVRTGDYTGEVDGIMGPKTREAIKRYQERRNIPQSGRASHELLALIESQLPRTISTRKPQANDRVAQQIANADTDPKSLDPDLVKRIQSGLAAATAMEIDIDGIFGNQTRTAIKAFQEKQGIAVTGEPDAATLERLFATSQNG